MSISRRQFICSAGAAAAAATMPAFVAISAPPAGAVAPKTWWIAGTPGEFDRDSFLARSAKDAEEMWRDQQYGDCDCGAGDEEGGDPEYVCDRCQADVGSQPIDPADPEKGVTPGDWLRGGSGFSCSRCDYETTSDDGGQGVGDEAVCEDCMTLADWEIVDPERAAEMRGDAALATVSEET